jgi:hypothetical protein
MSRLDGMKDSPACPLDEVDIEVIQDAVSGARLKWQNARSNAERACVLGDLVSYEQWTADAAHCKEIYADALQLLVWKRRRVDRAREMAELDAELLTLQSTIADIRGRLGVRATQAVQGPGHGEEEGSAVLTIGSQVFICTDVDRLARDPTIVDTVLEAGGAILDMSSSASDGAGGMDSVTA